MPRPVPTRPSRGPLVFIAAIASALLLGSLLVLRPNASRAASPGEAGAPLADLRPIASPAAAGSGEPHLAVGPDGRVWMSWLERRSQGGHALRGARLEGRRWSRPFTIAEGDSFFANWADFPTLLPLSADRLIAHYLWKMGEETYAYEVRLTRSADGGRSWSRPLVPHRDGTPTEHGFVSLIPAPGGTRAVWLDGRRTVRDSAGHFIPAPHGEGEMTVRTALVGPDGSLSEEDEVDPRACDCCQTSAVATDGGVLVAYRDRSPEEIRDISLARLENGRWSEPYPLHRDGWEIHGCPVNGPALASDGDRVAAAWFSGAQEKPRVMVAFSSDGGRTFGAPQRLDGGDPLGRVHVTLLSDGDALVTWLEMRDKEALIQARRAGPDRPVGEVMTVARTSAARASGFPRIVRSGDRVVLAWTEAGKPSQVRTAMARVAAAATR